MLTKSQIKLIEILDDAITDTINQHLVQFPELRKESSRFIDIVIEVLSEKFTDYSFTYKKDTHDYFTKVYARNIYEYSEEEKDFNKKIMLKISDSDLDQSIKLCFRKNEFKYLGDIALCSPALLLKLKDWDRAWHIPVRKELLKHGLDLCTKLKAWPMIRREMAEC